MRSAPRPHFLSSIASAAIALTMPLLSPSAHANLVTNGSFEDGTPDFSLPVAGVLAGGGTTNSILRDFTPGWVVGGDPRNQNALISNTEGFFDPTIGPHYNPDYFGTHGLEQVSAVLPHFPDYNAFISQVLATQIGVKYALTFYTSEQGPPPPLNSLTVNVGGQINTTLNVYDPGSDSYADVTSISGGSNIYGPAVIPVPSGWTEHYLEFVADATSTRLSFIGGDTTNAILLDDISVVVAVPEVSSLGMIMGLGLLGLGTAARIRRRSLASV